MEGPLEVGHAHCLIYHQCINIWHLLPTVVLRFISPSSIISKELALVKIPG